MLFAKAYYFFFVLQNNSDIYTVHVDGTKAVVQDRWARGQEKPLLDQSQDVLDSSFSISDNITSISFTRALSTGDPNDRDVIGCHYFLFAGGPLNLTNKDISYHNEDRTQSSQKICISACG